MKYFLLKKKFQNTIYEFQIIIFKKKSIQESISEMLPRGLVKYTAIWHRAYNFNLILRLCVWEWMCDREQRVILVFMVYDDGAAVPRALFVEGMFSKCHFSFFIVFMRVYGRHIFFRNKICVCVCVCIWLKRIK